MAVIFGAWLMQDNDLHERQIVLLADKNDALETHIEQQLRELTLLPLNIRRISLQAFQKEGCPRGVALIVTPYATPLPLFSPPLIHADRALTGTNSSRSARSGIMTRQPLWAEGR